MLSKIGFKQVWMPHADESNLIPLVINRFRVNAPHRIAGETGCQAPGLENPINFASWQLDIPYW